MNKIERPTILDIYDLAEGAIKEDRVKQLSVWAYKNVNSKNDKLKLLSEAFLAPIREGSGEEEPNYFDLWKENEG